MKFLENRILKKRKKENENEKKKIVNFKMKSNDKNFSREKKMSVV